MLTPVRKGSEYHHGDLKHAAVLSARALVAADGLSALGIRKVADRLSVTPAALYRHFESLEELRAALAAQVRIELAQTMTARRNRAPKSKSKRRAAISRFEAIGKGYVDYAKANPRLFEVAFLGCEFETLGTDTDLAWQVLLVSIDELSSAGLLQARGRRQAPMFAWSSIHGFATLVAQGAIPNSLIESSLRELFDGVQRALFSN